METTKAPKCYPMCPHCGHVFTRAKSWDLTPIHEFEGKKCPGSQQNPRNSLSDKRRLWKDGGES